MLLAVFLLFCARYANALPDESYYYVLAGRFAAGDRPFLHTWQMSQLGSLFLVIPYKIYTSIAHGTEGIILFMRQLFIAAVLLLYWYFYVKLRKKKGWGVLASALLCADQLFGIIALNYYNNAILLLAVIGMILFASGKKIPAWKPVLAGILLSAAVLNEPGLAFLYAAYTVLILMILIGEKQGKQLLSRWRFVLDKRIWLYLSVGVVLSAAAFLIYLQIVSGIGNVIGNLPQLFSDSEYRITLLGNSRGYEKIPNTAAYFGWFNVAAIPLLFAAVLCLRRKKLLNGRIRTILFFFSLALFVSCSLTALIRLETGYKLDLEYHYYLAFYSASSTIPVYALSLILWLLTEKRDRRLLAFWILAAGTSATVDFFSDIVLGYGGRLAYIPAVLCVRELLSELKIFSFREQGGSADEKGARDKTSARRRLRNGAAALLLCVAMLCETGIICAEYNLSFFTPRTAASSEAENKNAGRFVRTRPFLRGPYKGLRNTEAYTHYYDLVLDDLDRMLEETDGPFYTASNLAFCYLYVDRPVGAHSTCFVDSDFPERVQTYWSIYPERRPVAVYLPYDDPYNDMADLMSVLVKRLGGRIEKARAGSIVYISRQ